jgi:hypothetical protein
MLAPHGGLLGGAAGSPQDDRRSLTKAFRVWDASVLADGKQLMLTTTKVIRFSIVLSGAVAPQQTSDWLSLLEAPAFVFPAV